MGIFKILLANPRVPILGTLIHTFTFPLLAVGLVAGVIALGVEIEDYLLIGILLVAACPSGGFSNLLVLLARGDLALSVLLTAVSTILSFATVPFFFYAFGQIMPELSGQIELPIVETLLSLLLMIVVPVGIGMIWRKTNETFVIANTKRMQSVAQILLYVVVILIFILDWETFLDGIGSALPWSLGLGIVSLSTGYGISRLVGLNQKNSATIAIECSIRNLAVAFLIATSVLSRVDIAVLPSVYFVAVLIVGLSFARFWKTRVAPAYEEQPYD